MWWPTIAKDTHLFTRAWDVCQEMGEIVDKDRMPIHPILPLQPFFKWGLDFIGSIKPKAHPSGCEYIIVAMDYFTKWPEAKALWMNTASSCIKTS